MNYHEDFTLAIDNHFALANWHEAKYKRNGNSGSLDEKKKHIKEAQALIKLRDGL